jgi:hypothetical protein
VWHLLRLKILKMTVMRSSGVYAVDQQEKVRNFDAFQECAKQVIG